jgi:hypothetical protein
MGAFPLMSLMVAIVEYRSSTVLMNGRVDEVKELATMVLVFVESCDCDVDMVVVLALICALRNEQW